MPINQQFPNKKIFVISSKKLTDKTIIQTDNNINKLLSKLKGNTWLFGGGITVNEFLKKDLVTNLEIAIIPTVLGHRIKLFHPLDKELRWKLIESENKKGIVINKYETNKNESRI